MGENYQPKVLVIASTVFSKTLNNGKTLSSFFYGYSSDKISQLSFSMGDTNDEVCNDYYAITFSDVIKNNCGRHFSSYSSANIQNDEISSKSIIYRLFHEFSEKRSPLAIYIKNLIWKRVNLSGVYKWIEETKPDVVFFQGFSMPYGYDIALKICNKYGLPLILELTDDYTEHLYSYSIIERIFKKNYKKLLQKAIDTATYTLVISPKMKSEYKKRFGGRYIEMMNSVEIKNDTTSLRRDTEDYVYAGNVRLGRWEVLINFATALGRFNANAKLNVYTPDQLDSYVDDAFKQHPNIEYCGSLSATELQTRLSSAGNVVHVESFDKRNRIITRLSISTKIPEYMSSGALIYAIGPSDIASIEYLKSLNAAICISSKTVEGIERELRNSYKNTDRDIYISNAYNACQNYHDKTKNAHVIQEIVKETHSL